MEQNSQSSGKRLSDVFGAAGVLVKETLVQKWSQFVESWVANDEESRVLSKIDDDLRKLGQ